MFLLLWTAMNDININVTTVVILMRQRNYQDLLPSPPLPSPQLALFDGLVQLEARPQQGCWKQESVGY